MFGSHKGGENNIRFFCETCGAEVPRDAKECPQCGKRFASVLCPACGFAGGEALFKSGCPSCGYSAANPTAKSSRRKKKPQSKKPAAPLPFWIYILTAAAFTAVLAALFFTFTT